MKKIFTVVALLCISVFAFAEMFEVTKTMACTDAKSVFTELTDKYQEQPIWVGNINEALRAMVFVNPKTATWSLIVVDGKSETACAFASGEGYSYRAPAKSGTSL